MKNFFKVVSNTFFCKNRSGFRTMKITFILIIMACLSVNASNVNSQSISLNKDMKNMSIKNILKSIEKQSDYRFFYSDDFSVMDKKMNLDRKSTRLNSSH